MNGCEQLITSLVPKAPSTVSSLPVVAHWGMPKLGAEMVKHTLWANPKGTKYSLSTPYQTRLGCMEMLFCRHSGT